MIRIILILVLIPFFAFAETKTEKGEVSGYPIPRFVSLKSEEVNARSGPGASYPIKWVYTRQGLPVEVIAEFGNWRQIKDIEGEEGWVLQSLISGARTALTKSITVVYASEDSKRAVLRLSTNVQVNISKCSALMCEIKYNSDSSEIKGWVEKSRLWGVYGQETFD